MYRNCAEIVDMGIPRGVFSCAITVIVTAMAVSCAGRGETTAAPTPDPVLSHRVAPAAEIHLVGEATPAGLRLEARIDLVGRMPETPTLRIIAPDGVRVVSGATVEEIRDAKAGSSLTRVWILEGTGGPVQVTLRAANEAAGFSADASWPPDQPSPHVLSVPESERIPPVKIHGVTIDSSIPVAPASQEH